MLFNAKRILEQGNSAMAHHAATTRTTQTVCCGAIDEYLPDRIAFDVDSTRKDVKGGSHSQLHSRIATEMSFLRNSA